MTTFEEAAAGDPDDLDAGTLALVGEAAALLRSTYAIREAAVDSTVERVRTEAVLTVLASTIFGSIGRVRRATPSLLGLSDPPTPFPPDEEPA